MIVKRYSMDQNSQNEGKIIPFKSGAFEEIDYAMEDPENWSFEEPLEIEDKETKNKNCGKVKIKDWDSNKF